MGADETSTAEIAAGYALSDFWTSSRSCSPPTSTPRRSRSPRTMPQCCLRRRRSSRPRSERCSTSRLDGRFTRQEDHCLLLRVLLIFCFSMFLAHRTCLTYLKDVL